MQGSSPAYGQTIAHLKLIEFGYSRLYAGALHPLLGKLPAEDLQFLISPRIAHWVASWQRASLTPFRLL
jgi:hypothetical protein